MARASLDIPAGRDDAEGGFFANTRQETNHVSCSATELEVAGLVWMVLAIRT